MFVEVVLKICEILRNNKEIIRKDMFVVWKVKLGKWLVF